MVYKNLLIRLIFSSLFFLVYMISIKNFYLLLSLGSIIYLIIIYEIIISFKNKLFYILIYVIFSFLIYLLYFYFFFNLFVFNLLIVTIISFDTFSYIIGILFGKNYPFKKISPKKTVEGYLGGIFLTNVSIFLFFQLSMENYVKINYFLFINAIILFALLGDLIQSFFKRINNTKNSSSFLPGHGGFFDRFDGFIPSIMFLTFFTYLYNAY